MNWFNCIIISLPKNKIIKVKVMLYISVRHIKLTAQWALIRMVSWLIATVTFTDHETSISVRVGVWKIGRLFSNGFGSWIMEVRL
ncbi:hypothetical protein PanWU01x14_049260 [Parasponia andersonii]|uniref:Uncharacterized protein n=1 Tax=Parasponia andersonii TaxID=3476 RepID=A0A2P5DMK2_PARAD|nr:hypothetical protein PanWU01x14_049260 [Parasponia andersonii]